MAMGERGDHVAAVVAQVLPGPPACLVALIGHQAEEDDDEDADDDGHDEKGGARGDIRLEGHEGGREGHVMARTGGNITFAEP
jgi:hypothetical protein